MQSPTETVSITDICVSFGVTLNLCFLLMFILEGLRSFVIIPQLTDTCPGLSTALLKVSAPAP